MSEPILIDGKRVSAEIRAELKKEIAGLSVQPGFAVIIAGDDPASQTYVRSKHKACTQLGIYSENHSFPADCTTDEILQTIDSLNRNPRIHGILVQLPLPPQLDSERIIDAIDPRKDVDAFTMKNVGLLTSGRPLFCPCTPAGIVELLRRYAISAAGKECVIVGRSNIVGKPMALMMLAQDATVTMCHSHTADLSAACRRADILIAAVGRPGFITADMVKEGAVVIDVGINRLPDGSLTGDVDFTGVSRRASYITPVPGGVGPMTIAMLMANTVRAAKLLTGQI